MKRWTAVVFLVFLCGVAVFFSIKYDGGRSGATSNGSSSVDSVTSASFKLEVTSETSSDDLFKVPDYIKDENYRWYIYDGCAIIDRSYNTEAEHIDVPRELSGCPVTTFESDVFYQHTLLKSITLPDTLKTIDGAAFYRCYSLKEITIPKSVEVITNNPFFRASSLENIYVEEGNEHFVSVDGVLFDKEMRNLIAYPEGSPRTEYSIPEGVEYTDFGYSVRALRKLTIPASLKEVYDNVICYLSEYSVHPDNEGFCSFDGVLYDKQKETLLRYPPLKESEVLIIPEGVKYVENYAFYDIGAYGGILKKIHFPSSIVAIGTDNGFEGVIFVSREGTVAEQYAKDHNIMFRVAATE